VVAAILFDTEKNRAVTQMEKKKKPNFSAMSADTQELSVSF
jgi:hypothetical protein